MKFRFVNAKLNKPEDLTMDTLGELPAYVYKQYFKPEYSVYDRIFKYGKDSKYGPKLDKNALKDEFTKLINEGYTDLNTLREKLGDYLKSKKGDKFDPEVVYAKLKNSRRVPNIRVKNVWQYLMGKIGNTSAYFTTLREVPYENHDKFTTNIGGYEVYYKESKPKEVKDLPTWMAFVYGDFMDGDQYKVMPANEVVNYLSDTEDQVFDLYKI